MVFFERELHGTKLHYFNMSNPEREGARADDVVSEAGDDLVQDPFIAGAQGAGRGQSAAQRGAGSSRVGASASRGAFTRAAPDVGSGWGRGPVAVDKRKYRYDVNAALTRKPVPFSATKVDRLDASDAGDYLNRIHVTFGIAQEAEERIHAFDRALWYEHAVNGGSTLQAERGVIVIDGVSFDIPVIVKILGVEARRFFRAYADDISRCLRDVLEGYSPFDPESAEKWGAVMQVAVARGLQKYPYLIHDSSDAGVELSIEERMALQASKRYVISSTFNAADSVSRGPSGSAGFRSSAAVHVDDD